MNPDTSRYSVRKGGIDHLGGPTFHDATLESNASAETVESVTRGRVSPR